MTADRKKRTGYTNGQTFYLLVAEQTKVPGFVLNWRLTGEALYGGI